MDKLERSIRKNLAPYCEAGECEKCIVTRLIDDAHAELPDEDDDDDD